MKRSVVWLIMCVFLFSQMFLVGCANDAYHANMKYRSDKAMFDNMGRQQAMGAVTSAISMIIDTVEGDYKKVTETDNSSFTNKLKTGGAGDFAVAVLGDIVISMSKNHAQGEMMRARAEAIRYLEPIVAQIYKETSEEIGVPATSFDVAIKFVDNLPFLATVYGMYKLGTAGIENAANKITNNINGDSNLIHQNEMQIGKGNLGPGANSGRQIDFNNDKSTNELLTPDELLE